MMKNEEQETRIKIAAVESKLQYHSFPQLKILLMVWLPPKSNLLWFCFTKLLLLYCSCCKLAKKRIRPRGKSRRTKNKEQRTKIKRRRRRIPCTACSSVLRQRYSGDFCFITHLLSFKIAALQTATNKKNKEKEDEKENTALLILLYMCYSEGFGRITKNKRIF